VQSPKPVYPNLPFARPSAIGKIRFSYNVSKQAPPLVITNGRAMPREFGAVGFYRTAVGAEGSDDGLFQALIYAKEGEDGRLVVGRRGVLIRVFDVRGPECVLEITREGRQIQEIFIRWSRHSLLIYIGGEGLHAIDFDSVSATVTNLPPPIIPDILTLHDVAFLGAHADELYTGENRWRLCYEILPFPERPADDPRLAELRGLLPRKPDDKRMMLLGNGFGNLWTEYILRGK